MHLSTCSVSRASIRSCCSRQRCTAGPALVPRLHGRAAAPLALVRATPSSSSGDAQQPSGLSVEDAAKVLGCSSTASFDDILARKNALLDAAGPDKARCEEVEQAYDLLLSASLRRRLSGGASPSVRFADVSSPRKAASKGAQGGSIGGGPKLPSLGNSSPFSSLGVSLLAPRNQQVATQQAAVFSALALWAIIQAVVESPEAQLGDTAGTQLTLALAYSVYTLKENKRLGWGKAVGLSFGGLILFALLGTAVQSWLRVDIVPLGAFQSPGVFCTEFVIVGLMLGALFLA